MKLLVSAILTAFIVPIPQFAQTASSALLQPSLPLMLSYQYWPQQYVQFLGAELPYSTIEVDADSRGHAPIYDVILTESSTGRRIQYSNNDDIVLTANATGGEAHKAVISFEPDETSAGWSISMLRLTLANGEPLLWRFVQGSDISERGSGVTPLPQMPMPIISYREQGAVAGEGTALQVGSTVSAATVWKEMSQLPYFVAYHGAYTEHAQRLIFLVGQEKWTTLSAPAKLSPGGAWEMQSSGGLHRTLRIESMTGPDFVLRGSDRNDPSVGFVVHAKYKGDEWEVESIRYAPVKGGEMHYVDIQFSLPVAPDLKQVELEISAGKKTRLATGSITYSGAAGDRVGVLAFKKPDWLSAKSLIEATRRSATTIEQTAKP